MGDPEYEEFFAGLKRCLFKERAEFLEANKTKYEPRIRGMMKNVNMENIEKLFSDIEADYKKSLEKPNEPAKAEPPNEREMIMRGAREQLASKDPALGEYFDKNHKKYEGYINVMLHLDKRGDMDSAEKFYADMLLKVKKDFEKSKTSA